MEKQEKILDKYESVSDTPADLWGKSYKSKRQP